MLKSAATDSVRSGISAVLGAALMLAAGPTLAQYRAGQPDTVVAPSTLPRPADNVTSEFQSRYRAAGQPKIILFWNVEFDDSTETSHEKFDQTHSSNIKSSTSSDKQTNGPAGSSSLDERDETNNASVERITGDRIINPAKHATPLSRVNAVELETAFRRQWQLADVRFLNRDFSIRMAQEDSERRDTDPKLLETEAVRGRADWLLEVLMVLDARAPLGVGFKVTLTAIKPGTELESFYTMAQPRVTPMPSYYEATSTGFELQRPRVALTVTDVGTALAREVMESTRSIFDAQLGQKQR